MNRFILLSTWVLVLVAGCGGRSTQADERGGDGTDSHTHWLSRCTADADCDGELQCLCGTCSSPCETESTCDEFGAGAMCVELSCTSTEGAGATSLCSRACEGDSDCPGDARCDAGVCVAGDVAGALDAGSEPAPTQPEDDDAAFTPDLPPGCEFLSEQKAAPTCGDDQNRCDQMQVDGSTRFFNCLVLYSYEDEDGAPVTLDDDETSRRTGCVREWFLSRGTEDPTLDESSVRATGTWEQVGGLASVRGLECHPTCVDFDCGYCYELDAAACSEDAFCEPGYGSPVDTTAMCQEPARFATCRPYAPGCNEVPRAATDASGACWAFDGSCHDKGFDYSPADPACRIDLEECAGSSTAPTGCEAVDVTGTDDADCSASWTWNGSECELYSYCDCEGSECDMLFEAKETCETVWAGCTDAPACDLNPPPSVVVANIAVTPNPTSDDTELDVWTLVDWHAPLLLPVNIACDESYADFCGEPRALNLDAADGVELPSLTLTLPTTLWSILAIEADQRVEVMVNEFEFAVRDAASEDLLLLVGQGYRESDVEETPWDVSPVEVSGEAPFCTSAFTEDPECEQTEVTRSLRFQGSAPAEVDVTLEPFTLEDVRTPVSDGDATYRFVNGRSTFRGPREPRDECAAAVRDYEFIVARVLE